MSVETLSSLEASSLELWREHGSVNCVWEVFADSVEVEARMRLLMGKGYVVTVMGEGVDKMIVTPPAAEKYDKSCHGSGSIELYFVFSVTDSVTSRRMITNVDVSLQEYKDEEPAEDEPWRQIRWTARYPFVCNLYCPGKFGQGRGNLALGSSVVGGAMSTMGDSWVLNRVSLMKDGLVRTRALSRPTKFRRFGRDLDETCSDAHAMMVSVETGSHDMDSFYFILSV